MYKEDGLGVKAERDFRVLTKFWGSPDLTRTKLVCFELVGWESRCKAKILVI